MLFVHTNVIHVVECLRVTRLRFFGEADRVAYDSLQPGRRLSLCTTSWSHLQPVSATTVQQSDEQDPPLRRRAPGDSSDEKPMFANLTRPTHR